MEGIAAGKARGLYKGGKPRIDLEEVRRPAAEGMRPAHIARKLRIRAGRTGDHLRDRFPLHHTNIAHS